MGKWVIKRNGPSVLVEFLCRTFPFDRYIIKKRFTVIVIVRIAFNIINLCDSGCDSVIVRYWWTSRLCVCIKKRIVFICIKIYYRRMRCSWDRSGQFPHRVRHRDFTRDFFRLERGCKKNLITLAEEVRRVTNAAVSLTISSIVRRITEQCVRS